MVMMEEMLTKISGRLATLREREVIRRKSHKITLSQETTRTWQALDQQIITIAVFTTIQLTRTAKSTVEQEKQAGWRTDYHKITSVTITWETLIQTVVSK